MATQESASVEGVDLSTALVNKTFSFYISRKSSKRNITTLQQVKFLGIKRMMMQQEGLNPLRIVGFHPPQVRYYSNKVLQQFKSIL